MSGSIFRQYEFFDGAVTNTTPSFRYTRRQLTRYVLVLENTKDMLVRESWSFLRAAIRKWTVHDLPVNTEVGFILVNESSSVKVHGLHLLNGANARDWVASDVPFTPGDSRVPACISCGIKEALDVSIVNPGLATDASAGETDSALRVFQMLEEAKTKNGAASSVILVIAPGVERLAELEVIVERARLSKIKIATVNYPAVLRRNSLDALAEVTGGFFGRLT